MGDLENDKIYTLKDLEIAFKAGSEMVYYPAYTSDDPRRSESRPTPKYYSFDFWFERVFKKRNNP